MFLLQIALLGRNFLRGPAANNTIAKKKKASAVKIEDELSQFAGVASQVASAQIRLTKEEESSKKMERALQSRYYWIDLVNGIQGVYDVWYMVWCVYDVWYMCGVCMVYVWCVQGVWYMYVVYVVYLWYM